MTEESAIQRAIEKGVAFLESAQLPSGEIPIEISAGPDMSGERTRRPILFATALAARVLSITPSAERVRSRALDFLQREMSPEGLWRYSSTEDPEHQNTPFDLDDTSIASSALAAAGRPIPDNRRLLLSYRDRGGLFYTWMAQWWRHPVRTFNFFVRWRVGEVHDIDVVVNANVVIYLGSRAETRPAVEHMRAVLREGREMTSTIWYGSRFTVWYFLSHALLDVAPEAGDVIVSRVEATAPVNALELALAASTSLLWNRVPDVGPLLEAQLPSGAWPRAGVYHQGRRRMDAQPRPPWCGSEALTTVFAVEALSRRMVRSTRRGNSER